MQASCSCPDSANPCKHIAAVFYIRWRGRTRETLFERLQELRSGTEESTSGEVSFEKGDTRPIGECFEAFWSGETGEAVRIRSGSVEAGDATLKRLGDPPAGLADVHEVVAEYYSEMTR